MMTIVSFVDGIVDYIVASPLLRAIAIGIVIGMFLGVSLVPARLAGVDFRQWFKNPAQPSELTDDSWIGLMKSAAGYVTAALAVTLVIASILLWFPTTCRAPFSGVLHFVGSCIGFWMQWPIAAGLIGGVALVHLVADGLWRVGLRFLPHPAETTEEQLLARPPTRTVAAPEKRKGRGRRLIVCCDGTWNWPDEKKETNVVRLVRTIEPEHNGIPQIIHYHPGVGTGNLLDRIVGGGAGLGLTSSVKACYGFLVDNYKEGDDIFLFGFSRGAYVARSLAGVIGKVGVLYKSDMGRFAELWDWYTMPRDKRDDAILEKLAPKRHRNADIECIGVWDTVGALGVPGTRICAQNFAFHETQLGPAVRYAFQALAIDEERGNFQAAVWVANKKPRHGQLLEQVWFPGVHSNIGGGYLRHGLSDASFLWMLSRIAHWDLLGINRGYISEAVDRTEAYPVGFLENSRSGKWRWIGC